MKNIFIGLLAISALISCEHKAPATVAPPLATVNSPQTALTLASHDSLQPEVAAVSVADSLTAPMQQMLQRFDFTPLWTGQRYERATPVMDGFFGEDHRRIAFFFSVIKPDTLQPGLFHVQGKNRFQRLTTPFTGTIQLTTLADLPGHTFMDMDDATNQVYSAKADFVFEEPAEAKNSGTFTGQAFVDFFINSDGKLTIGQAFMKPDKTAPAKGAGVVYRGSWTSHSTRKSKPFVLTNDVFLIAPEMLPQFGIGERSGQMNPKYAKLGWSETWENDEWWAESPKPSLSL